jgi:ribosomal protein L21E
MKTKIHDKDLIGVEKALRRAGNQARKIALETSTPLVIYKDGQIVKIKVNPPKSTLK